MNDSETICKIRLLAENLSMEYHLSEVMIFSQLKESIGSGVSIKLAEEAIRAALDVISKGHDRFTVDDLVKWTGQSRDLVVSSVRLARHVAKQRGENPDNIPIENPDANVRE